MSDGEKIITLCKPDLNEPETKKQLTDGAKSLQDEKSCKFVIEDLLSPTYYSKFGLLEKQVVGALGDNEDGDARLFIYMFQNRYLFDHMEGRWYYWNDHYWRDDILQHRYRLFEDLIEIYNEQLDRETRKETMSKQKKDDDEANTHKIRAGLLSKRKEILQTLMRKNNVLSASSKGLNSLGYNGEGWDQKYTLLAVKNGVINLLTGEFDGSGGNQDDYIKTVAPTAWKGIDEPHVEWTKFLDEVFEGRPEMPNFLQRLFGYALRGDTPEHIFPIFFGEQGRNGKGTMFETIKAILGPLAYKAPSEFLMAKPGSQQSGDAPSATTMKLRGARLAWCSETNEGDRVDAAKLKELVGGDTLSARSPFGRVQVEFVPTHTLFTMTNLKPKMPPNDTALWRRIFLIEFLRTFIDNPDPNNPNEALKDGQLKEKLLAELSGILAWLVKGALIYNEKGLCPPQEILDATEKYRDDEDIFGNFIKECCDFGSHDNQAYKTKSKDLYENYKVWCSDAGHHAFSRTKFRKNLLTNKKLVEKMDGPQRERKVFGIALKNSFYTV